MSCAIHMTVISPLDEIDRARHGISLTMLHAHEAYG